MKIGDAGVCQGAEERSSLLSKLLFARYRGRRKANIMDGALESALSFFSLPSSRSSSPMPVKRNILLTNQEKPRLMSAVFSSPCKPPTLDVSTVKISTPMTFPASSLSRSMSSPSQAFSPSKSLVLTPPVLKMPIKKPTNIMHVVEVKSLDVEGGLNELLEKVKEVYGGEGKVKVKRKKKNKNQLYSFKYGGPEKAAQLLQSAIHNVKELQSKSELWKFTQRLEVTSVVNEK
jgi:hypothetical protein